MSCGCKHSRNATGDGRGVGVGCKSASARAGSALCSFLSTSKGPGGVNYCLLFLFGSIVVAFFWSRPSPPCLVCLCFFHLFDTILFIHCIRFSAADPTGFVFSLSQRACYDGRCLCVQLISCGGVATACFCAGGAVHLLAALIEGVMGHCRAPPSG